MLLSALLCASLQEPISEGEAPSRLPTIDSWLVIDAVDGRGRRPLRPNAVFGEFLAHGAESFPVEGQQHSGESGTAAWKWVAAAENGGPSERGGWGAALVDVPSGASGVYMARLAGAWELYVNGRALVGDAYRYGFGGVPVVLEEGLVPVMVSGIRGNFALGFDPVDASVMFEPKDFTRPDLVVGEGGTIELGATLHRTSTEPLVGARLELSGDVSGAVDLLPVAPLETRTVALTGRIANAADTGEVGQLEVVYRLLGADGELLASAAKKLRVVARDSGRLRTFRSAQDGSVQLFGERAPAVESADAEDGVNELPGMVVSLHGASVNARSQMGAYGAEPGLWIVTPTNRRPYGFDWQDWGREDVYEVRAEVLSRRAIDPARIYLTGHSMGGHGTWHVGANDPDGWAAIAPSAGWQSFDTYGGRPTGTHTELWHRADAASVTAGLVENLAQLPTYVLHGDADTTVRPDEARAMLELLSDVDHVDLRSHFEPGKGHWWGGGGEDGQGGGCVRWRGIFELFDEYRRTLPTAERALVPAELNFVTVDPAVDGQHHWIGVEQVAEVGRPARVRAKLVDGRIEVTAENVRHLTLDCAALGFTIAIDGQELRDPASDLCGASAPQRFSLVHDGGDWDYAAGHRAPTEERNPRRSGPFKRAFDREFVLVRGTSGTLEESALLLDLALRDAQGWWYRANGRAPILTDREYLARPELLHHNVILYGNAETNAAWAPVLGEQCPLILRRGFAQVGNEYYRGTDFAAMFCYPREGSDVAMVGVFADTGLSGARLHATSGHFISGVGIPDYLLFSSAVLQRGDDGVSIAGFFDNAWKYDPFNRVP